MASGSSREKGIAKWAEKRATAAAKRRRAPRRNTDFEERQKDGLPF